MKTYTYIYVNKQTFTNQMVRKMKISKYKVNNTINRIYCEVYPLLMGGHTYPKYRKASLLTSMVTLKIPKSKMQTEEQRKL